MTKSDKRPLEVHKKIKPQAYDIDAAGIVSNIVYVRWLEDLRMAILEKFWPVERQLKDGYLPVISKTEVRYMRPVLFPEKVDARMWVSKISKIRFTVTAELTVDDDPVIHATQSGCFVNLETKRPIKLPEKLIAIFEEASK